MLPQKKRQMACTITEKKTDSICYHGKKTGCAITEKRQMAFVIMKKKTVSMYYHEKKDR